MERPLVSIITPSFNCEKFIAETIQSVQNQTYQNWEMIIVDDGSTDKTVSIIKKLAARDCRIKFFRIRKNVGTGITRNTALYKANGRYIFFDADDL
jgi:glycosyltransferase involved in cell wall biosynthesis